MIMDANESCFPEDAESGGEKIGNVVPRSMSVSEVSTDEDDSCLKAASGKRDSILVGKFLDLVNLGQVDSTWKLVHRLIRMLRTCKYATEDIVSVFALAVEHHKFFIASLDKEISPTERAFILMAQLYISHCLVLDEYCIISNWHKYLFSTYCDLRSLNNAVVRILKRMDWNLRVDSDMVDKHFQALL